MSILSLAKIKQISKLLTLRTYLLSIVFIGYMWSESRSMKIFHFAFYLCFDFQPPGTNMKLVTELLWHEECNTMHEGYFLQQRLVTIFMYLQNLVERDGVIFIFQNLYLRTSMISYKKQKL